MPRAPMIETVKDKRVITDGNMVLEILLMREQLHTEGLLMVYVPKEKMLIQADAYIRGRARRRCPTEPAHDQSGGQRLAPEVERRACGAHSRWQQSVQRGARRRRTTGIDELEFPPDTPFLRLNCEVHQEVAMKQTLSLVIAAVTVLSLQGAAQNNAPDAGGLIADATKAMGTANLRSLQYTGTGSTNPTGQAFTTGGAMAAIHGDEVHDVGRLLRAGDAAGTGAH